MKKLLALLLVLSGPAALLQAQQDKAPAKVTVTGEVLDMACYLDHGAHGAKHAACAAKCIRSGLPVGIKSEADGQVYLLIGQHEPLNDKLADYAGKTITVTGKLAERDGLKLIENAEIQGS
jgi:hypothetical protein